MMITCCRLFFVLATVGLLAAIPVRAIEAAGGQSSLNDGYSLFYRFCDQEAKLSLLLWIKTTPPPLADYARRISATAKSDMAALKQFSASDAALRLDKVSLPSFELDVRKSMDDDRKHLLVWGSSGPAFVQALRMTQSEATNYGLHVAKILAETDPDAKRAQAMERIFEHWTALHAEAYSVGR